MLFRFIEYLLIRVGYSKKSLFLYHGNVVSDSIEIGNVEQKVISVEKLKLPFNIFATN